MVKKRTIGACVAGALLTPGGVALAESGDGDPRLRPVVNRAILGADGLATEAHAAQHKRLVRRHLDVAGQYADLKDVDLNERTLGAAHMAKPSREVREATVDLRDDIERIEERRAERREARRQAREALEVQQAAASSGSATAARSSGGAAGTTTEGSSDGGGGASAGLESVAACESGGDPTAVSSSGQYRGKYQFDRQTWQSVGGSGDPAAAPEAEQDRRAAQLQAQRGSSPWPVCGG